MSNPNTFTEMNTIAVAAGLKPIFTAEGEKQLHIDTLECFRCGSTDVIEDEDCDHLWCNDCDDWTGEPWSKWDWQEDSARD